MNRLTRIAKILALNTAFALLPPALLVVMSSGAVPVWRLENSFLFSLVYAHSIGGLCFVTLPRVWACLDARPAWLQWVFRVSSILVNTILGSLLACGILILFGWITPGLYWLEFWGSLKIAIFLSVLGGVSIGVYETFQWRLNQSALQLRTKELERERALKLATEAQLASLESRIHPHFLFNTLNSISSLIPEDPARAERLVEQMAALLRFSLDANQSGLVPLSAEMKVVADYLEIERARFGDRLRYRIDVAPELAAEQVPPLSVQTLVENSVKYAIAPHRAGGDVEITGVRSHSELKLEVSDGGPPFTLEASAPGHGIDNLKGRLATLFGSRGSLTLQRRDNRNRLTLSVPLHAQAHTRIPG